MGTFVTLAEVMEARGSPLDEDEVWCLLFATTEALLDISSKRNQNFFLLYLPACSPCCCVRDSISLYFYYQIQATCTTCWVLVQCCCQPMEVWPLRAVHNMKMWLPSQLLRRSTLRHPPPGLKLKRSGYCCVLITTRLEANVSLEVSTTSKNLKKLLTAILD